MPITLKGLSMSKTRFTFKLHPLQLSKVAVLLLLPLAALAQTSDKSGYLLDGSGGFIHSGTPGQCWHTGQWTPALAQEECDPVAKPQKVAAAPVQAAPVAATPAAKPAVIAQSPQAAPAPWMRFSADTLFDFNQFNIRAAGKKILDEASAKIRSLTGQKVEVVGHADRIGSNAYNQKLSVQRAQAVGDYLQSKGVPAERMVIRGVGETEPVTAAGACATGSKTQRIACLQPDRHVDIVVQGNQTTKP